MTATVRYTKEFILSIKPLINDKMPDMLMIPGVTSKLERKRLQKSSSSKYEKTAQKILNKLSPNNFEVSYKELYSAVRWCDWSVVTEICNVFVDKCTWEVQFVDLYLDLIFRLSKELAFKKIYGSFKSAILTEVKQVISRPSTENESDDFRARKRDLAIGRLLARLTKENYRDFISLIHLCYEHQRLEILTSIINFSSQRNIKNQIVKFFKSLNSENLPSRQRFLIMDVFELAENNWNPVRKSQIIKQSSTNISSKSAIDIEKKIKSCLTEYLHLGANKDGFEEVKYFLTNFKDQEFPFIKFAFDTVLEKTNKEQQCVKQLALHSLVSKEVYQNALSELFEIQDDLKIDIPKITEILKNLSLA